MIKPSRRAALAAPLLLAAPAWAQSAPIRLRLVTGEGAMTAELYADKAPLSVANFLRYADHGLFDGSEIYRAMRTPGAPTTGLIQGGAKSEPYAPIAHEPTTRTGLKHTDGTLSLARRELGSARSAFFICVGDQPYLDADPTLPGDNQGFAAFGRVVDGMEVARKILGLPTALKAEVPEMAGQMLDPPVKILSAKRV
jgi:peptidyl-prolyl cis-trans isomerase A (cyclophilin A)